MNGFDDIFKEEHTPFDKGKWAEEKQIEREWTFNTISETLDEMKENPELYVSFLDTLSRFERYSIGNILLITAQLPEASRLFEYEQVKKRGGYVSRGEKGIVLLEPGEEYTRDDGSKGVSYKTKKVFDVSQTSLKARQMAAPNYDTRLLIKALISNAPCNFEVTDKLANKTMAKFSPEDKTVYVRENMKGEEIFRAIAQELTHAHLYEINTDRNENSFIAYSAAYVLCSKYGIDTSSFTFTQLPDKFKDYDTKEMRADVNSLRNIVKDISTNMYKTIEKVRADKEKNAR